MKYYLKLSICILSIVMFYSCNSNETKEIESLELCFTNAPKSNALSLRLILGDRSGLIDENGDTLFTSVEFDKKSKISTLKNSADGRILSSGMLVNHSGRYFWAEQNNSGNWNLGMVQRNKTGLVGLVDIQHQMIYLDSLRKTGDLNLEGKSNDRSEYEAVLDQTALNAIGPRLNKIIGRYKSQKIVSAMDWILKFDPHKSTKVAPVKEKLIKAISQENNKMTILVNGNALVQAELFNTKKELFASNSSKKGIITLDLDSVQAGQYLLMLKGPEGKPEMKPVRVDK